MYYKKLYAVKLVSHIMRTGKKFALVFDKVLAIVYRNRCQALMTSTYKECTLVKICMAANLRIY